MPSRATLIAWARLLKYFRYYRHYSGHSPIEDEFVFALKPAGFMRELEEKLHGLAHAHGQRWQVGNFEGRVLIGLTDSKALCVTPQTLQAAIELSRSLGFSLTQLWILRSKASIAFAPNTTRSCGSRMPDRLSQYPHHR